MIIPSELMQEVFGVDRQISQLDGKPFIMPLEKEAKNGYNISIFPDWSDSMFDKRLTALCPESKKYIVGNIILQWLELALNTVMIITVAKTISKLYYKEWTMSDLTLPIIVILTTLVIRFFTAQGATRMSYLASKTVKQKRLLRCR